MEWMGIIKDLHAGTIGGVAGIVAGYPMDTVKVRLQTQCSKTLGTNYTSPISLIRHIVTKEGVYGLYKGMFSPIISNAPINAVVFAVYGQTSRLIQMENGGLPLSPVQHMLAGSVAGLLQTAFSSPSELVKITLQVDQKSRKTSTMKCAQSLYAQYGVRKGLFRGWLLTAARDVPSFGLYFYTYDVMKSHFTGGDSSKENTFNLLMSGGLAGTVSWAALHPVDVIKSRFQCKPPHLKSSISQVVKEGLATEGPQFLMKGFGATVIRAFPVSAVTFLVYEKCMAAMG